MITPLSLLLQMSGVLVLVAGYRDANRNALLAAAVFLWIGSCLSGILPEFIGAVVDACRRR
jgi:hypothetical protein